MPEQVGLYKGRRARSPDGRRGRKEGNLLTDHARRDTKNQSAATIRRPKKCLDQVPGSYEPEPTRESERKRAMIATLRSGTKPIRRTGSPGHEALYEPGGVRELVEPGRLPAGGRPNAVSHG